MEAQGLGDEDGRQAHVDVGAVKVEGIPGGHHQADHRLGAAQRFHLAHELGQGAFGGAGAQHDQQLVLDVAEEAQDVEPDEAGDDAQDDDHEQGRGQVEGGDQAEQVAQRRGPVLADRVGHGAEGADGGGLHDQADDPEHALGQFVDHGRAGP